MTTTRTITTETPWLRLALEEKDWAEEEATDLQRWLEQMLLIRRFEEKILELHGLGLVHGPARPPGSAHHSPAAWRRSAAWPAPGDGRDGCR